MKEQIELDTTPVDEECAQLGSPDYTRRARIEARAFIHQLQRQHPVPEGAPLAYKVKGFTHDFGLYYQVVIEYDSEDEAATDYAFRVEGDLPAFWDAQARDELAQHGYDVAREDAAALAPGNPVYFTPTPQGCDLCGAPFPDGVMYDQATTQGPWGNLCSACSARYGRGLGVGRGQKYQRQPDGRFLQTAGGQSTGD